jgi:hypothetical protein
MTLVVRRWFLKCGRVCLIKDRDALLTFYDFPGEPPGKYRAALGLNMTGRAYAGCTQGAATNSKAAKPGRPTALHRTAWEGSSDLSIPFMRRKRTKARPDKKSICSEATFLRRWSFCS